MTQGSEACQFPELPFLIPIYVDGNTKATYGVKSIFPHGKFFRLNNSKRRKIERRERGKLELKLKLIT